MANFKLLPDKVNERADKLATDYSDSIPTQHALKAGYIGSVRLEALPLVEALRKFVKYETAIKTKHGDDYFTPEWREIYDTARKALKDGGWDE